MSGKGGLPEAWLQQTIEGLLRQALLQFADSDYEKNQTCDLGAYIVSCSLICDM